jgi:hypothetical protein
LIGHFAGAFFAFFGMFSLFCTTVQGSVQQDVCHEILGVLIADVVFDNELKA